MYSLRRETSKLLLLADLPNEELGRVVDAKQQKNPRASTRSMLASCLLCSVSRRMSLTMCEVLKDPCIELVTYWFIEITHIICLYPTAILSSSPTPSV